MKQFKTLLFINVVCSAMIMFAQTQPLPSLPLVIPGSESSVPILPTNTVIQPNLSNNGITVQQSVDLNCKTKSNDNSCSECYYGYYYSPS